MFLNKKDAQAIYQYISLEWIVINTSCWGSFRFDLFTFIFSNFFSKKKEKTEDEDDIIADLLLWAIFVDRKEIAEICWLRGKDQLCRYNIIVRKPTGHHNYCIQFLFLLKKRHFTSLSFVCCVYKMMLIRLIVNIK